MFTGRCVLGIDPGRTGGIAIVAVDEPGKAFVSAMPDSDASLAQLLTKLCKSIPISLAYVERAQPMPGQGVISMFTYGQHFGAILQTLVMLAVGVELIPPQSWQKVFPGLANERRAPGTVQETGKAAQRAQRERRAAIKKRSLALAKELYPHLIPKIKNKDGLSDALLIGTFGARTLRVVTGGVE